MGSEKENIRRKLVKQAKKKEKEGERWAHLNDVNEKHTVCVYVTVSVCDSECM